MKLERKILRYLEDTIGDSWYILDIQRFINNYNEFLSAFKKLYPLTEIAYSYKTNYIPLICKTVNDLGGYAEVVSEMEYCLAVDLGVDCSKIIVNGPCKPTRALERYLINGSIVNLDSYVEVLFLKKLAKRFLDRTFNVGIRCNFELSSQPFSRFGFDVNNTQFFEIIEDIRRIPNINLVCLHCHYPNRDVNSFVDRINKMITLYEAINKEGVPIYINIGGGFGGRVDNFIKDQLSFNVGDYHDYADIVASTLKNKFKKKAIKPKLLLEPGTALVADTMRFLCKVIEIKKIRNRYFAITSGSQVNFQSRTSKIKLPINVYGMNENNRSFYESIDITGYTCMEDDIIYEKFSGKLGIGDYIEINNVGSYSIVFKPPFINPNVPIITYIDGKLDIIKKKEEYDYIFQLYKKQW
jgi:diaminopimelate decarboxylase